MPVWAETVAVFDTETTGVSTAHARVVSATIALIGSDGGATERYDWLINPGIDIPEQASRVHGITTAVARASGIDAAHGIQQIIAQLTSMLSRGYGLVIYNAPYDLTLLSAEAQRHGLAFPETIEPVLDPLVLDKQLDRYRKGKRTLEAVAAHYGVPLHTAHDAGADAIAAGNVLQAITRKYADLMPGDLQELHTLQQTWAHEQAASFQEYMRRVKDPSFIADGSWPLR